MALSYQDLPSVKSRNKNQLKKLWQYVFDPAEDDKEAIQQEFQTILAKKKPDNVKNSLKLMFLNFQETQKKPSVCW